MSSSSACGLELRTEQADMIMPEVQYPHWKASSSRKACCTGWSCPFAARPSMVMMGCAETESAETRQERMAFPRSSTVHAPHWPSPQPYLVPVRPRRLRNTESKDSPETDSVLCSLPLTLSVMAGMVCLEQRQYLSSIA